MAIRSLRVPCCQMFRALPQSKTVAFPWLQTAHGAQSSEKRQLQQLFGGSVRLSPGLKGHEPTALQ